VAQARSRHRPVLLVFHPRHRGYLRIGMPIVGAAVLFGITTANGLVAFYDNGHGPVAALPLIVQMGIFLLGGGIILYWTHRLFHGNRMWRYHSVRHSSEELEWISAARFHPINLFLGSVAADVVMLLIRVSPNVLVVLGPVYNRAFDFRPRQSRLDAWPIQIRDCRPGLSSLAPHRCKSRRREEFCRDISDLGCPVRHVLHASG
jgi:sterol desaturase/sphingolipid hydroxylase (fatty acid hydroxylase superfamily)